MDDRVKVQNVEFVVDCKGKVWLNVDGVCVFRCGHTLSLYVDLPRVDRIPADHIVLVFPKEEVNVTRLDA